MKIVKDYLGLDLVMLNTGSWGRRDRDKKV